MGKSLRIVRNILFQGFVVLCVPMVKMLLLDPDTFCDCFIMNRRYPLTVESGEGCWLKTTDGQKYLDCVSGIATCALGHSNAELNAAVTKQMQTMHHVSNLYFIPAQAALANWLCENSGADKVFFCNSGAEANEAAIKVARRHASNRGITVSTTSGSRRKASLFLRERTSHGH